MTKIEILIIGSGPAGISAALPLLESGIHVAMVDGSSDLNIPNFKYPDIFTESFGKLGEGLFRGNGSSPKMELSSLIEANAYFQNVLGLSQKDFKATGAILRGGLSNFWGANLAEYDQYEFPLSASNYKNLKESYLKVGNKIGFSDVLNEKNNINSTASLLYERYLINRTEQLTLYKSKNAILRDESVLGRSSCVGCNKCLWQCKNKSIYSSAYQLNELLNYTNFKLIDEFIVQGIEYSDDCIRIFSTDGRKIQAKKVMMGAGVFGTAKIILDSFNLSKKKVTFLNNPVAILPIFVPGAVKKESNLIDHSLAQISFESKLERFKNPSGAIYSIDGIPLTNFIFKSPLSKPLSMYIAHQIKKYMLVSTIYFSGEYSRNYLYVEGKNLKIVGGVSDEFRSEIFENFIAIFKASMKPTGGLFPFKSELLESGVDNHYAGTFPMNGYGDVGTNEFGQLNFAKNIYIIDSSSFKNLPSRHLTYTIMANSHRIGMYVSQGFNKK